MSANVTQIPFFNGLVDNYFLKNMAMISKTNSISTKPNCHVS